MASNGKIRFPLRLDENFSKEIDKAVYLINKDKKTSKHQFILDAIHEKIKRQERKKTRES